MRFMHDQTQTEQGHCENIWSMNDEEIRTIQLLNPVASTKMISSYNTNYH